MKTAIVVLFAVVATTYAASEGQTGKSSDLANLDPVEDTEGQIPVQVVYANQKVGDESTTSLRRDKRFLFAKLLLAKAALGAGALAVVKAAPYVNVQKTWAVAPVQYNVVKSYPAPAWTWTKSYQPLPLPAATATVAAAPVATAAVAPVSYTWTKPFWPAVYVHKTYGPPATVVSTASTASTAPVAPATYGGTLTWTKSYTPLTVTGAVATSSTNTVSSD